MSWGLVFIFLPLAIIVCMFLHLELKDALSLRKLRDIDPFQKKFRRPYYRREVRPPNPEAERALVTIFGDLFGGPGGGLSGPRTSARQPRLQQPTPPPSNKPTPPPKKEYFVDQAAVELKALKARLSNLTLDSRVGDRLVMNMRSRYPSADEATIYRRVIEEYEKDLRR
jgi:hypothetical protein